MTRRVVRLLVLLGVAVGAYLVLCLFDHAARADTGSIGATDPVASVETAAAGALPEPKSIIPKSHPQKIHRPTVKVPEVQAPKVRAPKVQTPKVQAPKKIHTVKIQVPSKIRVPDVRSGETVRRAQVRTSQLRQSASDVVGHAARAAVTPTRSGAVRRKVSIAAQRPSPARLAELPDLPPAELPALPRPPSWPEFSSWSQLPGLPQAELPAWSQLPALQQLPSWPQLPSWSELPGLPRAELPAWPQLPTWSQSPGLPQARTLALTRTTASPNAFVPQPALVCSLVQSPTFAPAPELSGVTKPPATQAQPRTAPLPAPLRQPADYSTPAGQARDSGGGNAPAMGTVSSSWRPEVTAAGRRVATDLIARGRTIRYAGPPS